MGERSQPPHPRFSLDGSERLCVNSKEEGSSSDVCPRDSRIAQPGSLSSTCKGHSRGSLLTLPGQPVFKWTFANPFLLQKACIICLQMLSPDLSPGRERAAGATGCSRKPCVLPPLLEPSSPSCFPLHDTHPNTHKCSPGNKIRWPLLC